MPSRATMSLSLASLLLGGSTVGCAMTSGGGVASASSQAPAADTTRAAAELSAKATKSLAKGRADDAVALAERAVALRPGDAGYRTLLGQSYLKAGRFTSAAQAFGDVLRLAPDDGKAALNLSLAQIGTGDWAGARRTLDAHEATIAPGDRGLAIALAGDPQAGAQVLLAAARAPDATVTTRQNLGLALALAGHWQEARIVAATDLSPADVDGRMAQWAAFSRPTSASDQVAALLRVVPMADAGQPAQLALVAPVPADKPVQAVAAAAVAAPELVAAAELSPEAEPVSVAAATDMPASAAAPVPVSTPARVPAILPTPGPIRIAARPEPARALASGTWYVQFGAYQNQAVARDSWPRLVRREAALRGRTPLGVAFSIRGANFYRVSIGGFARGDADRLCRRFKARGGDCFVRAGAGEQLAAWMHKGVQLASR